MEIKFTFNQVQQLLDEQKRKVVDKLQGQSSYYNSESTEGHLKSLPIDKQKFVEAGMSTAYPDDIITLKRYMQ